MKSKSLFVMLSALVMMFMAFTPVDALRSYNIILKAGSHGMILDDDELIAVYDYGDVFDETQKDLLNALVMPEEGYYFTGYSPELPDEVTREETFVAQYRLIIDQVTYQVNYLDEEGNQLATPLVKVTEKGALVSVIAEEIENYAVDAAAKSATIDQDGVQITFIYTLIGGGGGGGDADDTAGDGTTVIINPGTGTGITVVEPDQGDTGTDIDDDDVPTTDDGTGDDGTDVDDDDGTDVDDDDDIDIDDDDVPTSGGFWNTSTIAVVGFFSLLLLAILIRFLFFGKKRRDQE